ncbi:PREDICTED: collagen alpha-1(III) chain-like [Ceratotherium simum simum]|uniref:Collagen alpha-1(III) chain-like n=1 Tax=Ceratotherium simum simum TaxID=73337 RepID=A0ABM1C9Y0_CERSS|nr:PREDICTED: collagen alpha-1(III) chain-like [Ceratotherium simum simum]
MAGRGRDSKSVEAPRARAGEVRGRGEPSPSGGRPGNRELAPGPPSPLSQRNPRVGRPPQVETKSRGAGGKVVGGRRGRAAGAGFVRLGLGGLRPAAFPRLRGARQSRGLRGHRRLPGGSGAGSRGRGPLLGRALAPAGSLSASRREGGAPGQPQHPERPGPIPEAALGEKRKEAGTEVAAWGRRSAGG